MKFTAAFVAAALPYLLPLASAQDDVPLHEPAVDAVAADLPVFTPTNLKAPFLEQFTDDWETRWQPSHAKKSTKEDEEEWAYVGQWAVEEPKIFKAIEGDKGLVVKNAAAHHAISSKFPKAIDPKGKELVVQYEVKFQDTHNCGGAYMKLLRDNKALHADEFSNASPYVIMFGPDKCGSTNKVHFIFNHKNPKTGEYEEKHFDDTVGALTTKGISALYTLHIKPDQTFQILVNGKAEHNGTFADDFRPSVNPPKEIDDPKDTKPSDWVDDAKISDLKPEDWDEDAPFQIEDAEAEKPADWLDDEPQMVADPDAVQPEDWDDEEDGDWDPPLVPNPKCADASGCGPWERPSKRNPDYKGKWSAAMIDNPLYKGVWAPRKISNPDYFEDKTPANLEPIGAIGFELWTMQADILFDNIYIGHSIEDAKKLQEESFDIKFPTEQKLSDDSRPKPADDKVIPARTGAFLEDPVTYIRTKVELFIGLAKENPQIAIKEVPEVAGAIGAIILSFLLIFTFGGAAAASSPQVQDAAKKVKEQAEDAKDKVAEAVSSGADKASAEITKRTTRSSGSADS